MKWTIRINFLAFARRVTLASDRALPKIFQTPNVPKTRQWWPNGVTFNESRRNVTITKRFVDRAAKAFLLFHIFAFIFIGNAYLYSCENTSETVWHVLYT